MFEDLKSRYDAKIDAKSRVPFPKKFRKIFGDQLVISHGNKNSLIIVPKKEWRTLLKEIPAGSFIDDEARSARRFLLGEAVEVELDSKGRFILPAYLRDHARIKNDVVFLGVEDSVEVWDVGLWEKEREELRARIPGIGKRLAERKGKNE